MKRLHQSLIIFVHVTVAVIVGCARIPTQEMSDARQAIRAARDVEAEYYVPTMWANAEQNLKLAEQNLETGKLNNAGLVAMLAKEQAVNAHNMTVAVKRAKKVWQIITAMNYSAADGYTLLENTQLAAHQGDFHKTIALAEAAYKRGKLTLNRVRLDKAKNLLDKINFKQASLNPDELVTFELAQMAHYHQEGKKAYDLANSLYQKLP